MQVRAAQRLIGGNRPWFWAGIALAGSLVGCAGRGHLGTTAASFLNHAQKSADPNIRHKAYAKLADANCYDHDSQRAEAAEFLGTRLDEKLEPPVTRAVICRTLGELRRPEGREPLRRACDDPEPVVRAAACRALGKLGDPEDIAVLARIMAADNDGDCRIAAIEGLGEMKQADERVKVTLIDGMENTDPAIRLVSYESLQKITGMDPGPEPGAWKKALGLLPPDAATASNEAGQSAPGGETIRAR